MTPQEFAEQMRSWQSADTELAHVKMDDLMCEVLRSLGYGEGVEVFENADKWYA